MLDLSEENKINLDSKVNFGKWFEGQVRACRNECEIVKQVCLNGKWDTCSARKPGKEVCDGLDKDCNGIIDDKVFFKDKICVGPKIEAGFVVKDGSL